MKCKLCKTAKADKKNSHIIPKFLKKDYLARKGRLEAIKFKTTKPKGKHRDVQDIPKDDYIFCTNCESRLSTLETYFANNLYNHLHKASKLFKVKGYSKTKVKSSKEVNGNLINLFVQSILWRQHISNHESMINFSIDDKDASDIRKTIE